MRRILHIVDSLDRTGVARQLLVLAEGLLAQGWDVHVAALRGGAMVGEFAAAGATTVELHRRWSFDPIACGRLNRLVARLRPEVIHTWDASGLLYGCLATRRAPDSRLVIGQHRIEPATSVGQLIKRRLKPSAGPFVVSSPILRDGCGNCGSPENKVVVIPPGVPPAPSSDVTREELLGELALPANARLIGVVGRLAPHKRVKDLIWAADLLRVLHDNLRLLVIGDGPLRPQLERYARLASDLEHIRFLGERSDVWRVMPHLDVLWNASEPRRHSIAILEAMAAGVPVVASDTPFNREIVVENETGYLIPHATRAARAARARQTDRLFTDADSAARLVAAARQRVAEHFSAARMVAAYAELYCRGVDAPVNVRHPTTEHSEV